MYIYYTYITYIMDNREPIVIRYWPIRGLVEFCITLLEYVQHPYTRTNVENSEEWAKEKEELVSKGFQFPNLPYLAYKGEYHSESFALLGYIASIAGRNELLPTPATIGRFLELFGVIQDLNGIFSGTAYSTKTVEEFRQKVAEGVANPSNLKKIQEINSILISNKWLQGDQITILDFRFADLVEKILDIEADLKFDNYGTDLTGLRRYNQDFLDIPEVKQYRSSDRFVCKQYNMSFAAWNLK